MVYLLTTLYVKIAQGPVVSQQSVFSSTSNRGDSASENRSPYQKVQVLSFNIYTGGAPGFLIDEATGGKKHNPECIGCKLFYQGLFSTNASTELLLTSVYSFPK